MEWTPLSCVRSPRECGPAGVTRQGLLQDLLQVWIFIPFFICAKLWLDSVQLNAHYATSLLFGNMENCS